VLRSNIKDLQKKEQNVQVSDTTGDAIYPVAGIKNKNSILRAYK
jgi:hypothetical protein